MYVTACARNCAQCTNPGTCDSCEVGFYIDLAETNLKLRCKRKLPFHMLHSEMLKYLCQLLI